MSSIGEVKRITDDSPKFREVLFARGYLFTDAEIDGNAFPFMENGGLRKSADIVCWYTPRRNTMRCKLRILRWC